MVNNHIIKLIVFLCLLSGHFATHAETTLTASIDRNKIYEMDTFNLTIQGQIDMEISFGGLMSFGLGQKETPEIPGLESNFEILDTQQSYNMQSINGESKAQVYWKYTLAPKTTGTLLIPAATYKDGKTNPIQITVLEGKAPHNASEPPAVFFEVETDKEEAYVQEQIIYTLRLYTQGLVNGELSEPTSTDAIIEPLGDQKKYYRMAFNQRYEVVERQYLVFPQKSGSLRISEQTFQGVSLKHGRRTRLKDISEPIDLKIKPPVKSFSGTNWLPATSLFLNEQWQGDPDKLQVGDSLTRKIELSALGLLGSALPPISMNENPLYKLYTDKPQTESARHETGVQSKRVDSFAIVAISDGEVQLDEIRIPWWDTVNDVERVAIIPARKLSFAVNPQLSSSTIPQPIQDTSVKAEPGNTQQINNQNKSDANTLEESVQANTQPASTHIWQTLAGLMFILWIVTSGFFYRELRVAKLKLLAIPTPKNIRNVDEKSLFQKAVTSVKNSEPELVNNIIFWLNACLSELGQRESLRSWQQVQSVDMDLYRSLSTYDQSLYASQSKNTFDKEKMLTAMKELRSQLQENLDGNKNLAKGKLEPFYQ